MAYPLVAEYFEKKMLSSLGYRFDPDEITDFEVDVYREINNRLHELEEAENKKKKPRGK